MKSPLITPMHIHNQFWRRLVLRLKMGLKLLPELKTYQKKLEKLLDENLVDLILFGSFVKGGTPKDIDIALLVREKEKVNFAELKKKIQEIIPKNIDLQMLDISAIHSPLWLTLIKEGFSVQKNEFVSALYKIKPMVLYKYSLQKLTNVQKVQFERGIKNVLGKEGNVLTRSVVLIPVHLKNAMMEFLKNWDIYYEGQEYELLPVLRKEELY